MLPGGVRLAGPSLKAWVISFVCSSLEGFGHRLPEAASEREQIGTPLPTQENTPMPADEIPDWECQ